MIMYLYKITQAVVLSYIFIVIANLFGFGLNIKWFFLFAVLPLGALSTATWAGQNQPKINAVIKRWIANKLHEHASLSTVHPASPAGGRTPYTVHLYLWWFLKDIVSAFNRYVLNFYNLTLILILLVIFDILVIDLYSDIITVVISFYWLITMVKHKLEGRFSIVLALLFLPLCPLYIQLGMGLKAEKSGVWVFMFLAIGVFRMVWEEIRSTKQFRQIDELLPELKTNYSRLRAWAYSRYENELVKEKVLRE